jgi:hypothetical protein
LHINGSGICANRKQIRLNFPVKCLQQLLYTEEWGPGGGRESKGRLEYCSLEERINIIKKVTKNTQSEIFQTTKVFKRDNTFKRGTR